MRILYTFLLGIIILIGAILLNVLASRVGLLSWFEFLKNPDNAGILSYIWLFVLYPLGLGVIAYFASRLLHI